MRKPTYDDDTTMPVLKRGKKDQTTKKQKHVNSTIPSAHHTPAMNGLFKSISTRNVSKQHEETVRPGFPSTTRIQFPDESNAKRYDDNDGNDNSNDR